MPLSYVAKRKDVQMDDVLVLNKLSELEQKEKKLEEWLKKIRDKISVVEYDNLKASFNKLLQLLTSDPYENNHIDLNKRIEIAHRFDTLLSEIYNGTLSREQSIQHIKDFGTIASNLIGVLPIEEQEVFDDVQVALISMVICASICASAAILIAGIATGGASLVILFAAIGAGVLGAHIGLTQVNNFVDAIVSGKLPTLTVLNPFSFYSPDKQPKVSGNNDPVIEAYTRTVVCFK